MDCNKRTPETINKELKTGEIEIQIKSYEILGTCKELPLPVFSDQEYSEEIRLKYRFLDLKKKKNSFKYFIKIKSNFIY